MFSFKPRLFLNDTPRNVQIALAQLRCGFSNLNFDLYRKGCIDYAMCACGSNKEDATHFLLKCSLYTDKRNNMLHSIKGGTGL